jgi:drug/metabolite transporter (DMT)-like permease
MPGDAGLASAVFGLAAAASWGVGDFCGGFASRRARIPAVMLVSQGIGLALFLALAALTRERPPSAADLAWGAAAGLSGLVGIAALYRAMQVGQMGIVAPVSGVVCAALPAVVGALTEGLPEGLRLAGFASALGGIWLVSSPGAPAATAWQSAARPAGLGLALLSGLGFGGFLVLVAQAQPGAVFAPLAAARAASIACLGALALARRWPVQPPRAAMPPIAAAGALDGAGNCLFLLAAQAGRLDVAGVLSSLYPAATVVLALIVLRERLARQQVAGVSLALIAIPLITMA